jgi:hypothetical protein
MSRYIFLLLLSISSNLEASEWRTPNTSADIAAFRTSGSDLNGNFLGLTGQVRKISTGYKGKPLFALEVADEQGTETILIGSLLNAELSEGDTLEVLGDVIPVQDQDEMAKKLTKDSFMMLGLCIVNQTKNYAQGAEPAKDLCNKWYLQEFPKGY